MLRVEGTIFMNAAAYEVFGKRPFDTNRDFDPPKIHSLPDEDFTIVDVNPNGKDIKKVLAIELGEDGVPLVDIRSPTKIIGFGQNSLEASLEGLPSDLYWEKLQTTLFQYTCKAHQKAQSQIIPIIRRRQR